MWIDKKANADSSPTKGRAGNTGFGGEHQPKPAPGGMSSHGPGQASGYGAPVKDDGCLCNGVANRKKLTP